MHAIEAGAAYDLFNAKQSRAVEHALSQQLPAHTMMQRAGLAVARLAMALAPRARSVWLACGPGNNGGDGLQAAAFLQSMGKHCHVSWAGAEHSMSTDTVRSLAQARQAGVHWCDKLDDVASEVDLCIDAMLGLGSHGRAIEGQLAQWITQIGQHGAPVLAVDLPTGLNPDTGEPNKLAVRASHTLSLLTLKPGLFTGHGRDLCGQVWLESLQAPQDAPPKLPTPAARLLGAPTLPVRAHASHKGSYGDVAVLGGGAGMAGAAVLAGSAALHGGAGRVYVSLHDSGAPSYDPFQSELMFRAAHTLELSSMAVVCGCGAGDHAGELLGLALPASGPLVLDADALNAIAADSKLAEALRARSRRRLATVITPHPLEAGRLLACSSADVQRDRLSAAERLVQSLQCCVVLKGSGTVVAMADQIPRICPTGNAKLATAGTGDVLAGLIGARLAQGMTAFDAACAAVYQHGALADEWPDTRALTAGRLARALSP